MWLYYYLINRNILLQHPSLMVLQLPWLATTGDMMNLADMSLNDLKDLLKKIPAEIKRRTDEAQNAAREDLTV